MMNSTLKEDKQHGRSDFPVNIYEVDYTEGYTQILPCHWHEECEIIYITRGSSLFRIGENSFEVHEGQILFVNSNELHSSYCDNPCGCSYTALVFHVSFLNSNSYDAIQTQYINPLLFKQLRFQEIIPQDSPVFENARYLVYHAINSLREKKEGYELYIKGSIYMLLSLLIQNQFLMKKIDVDKAEKNSRSIIIKKIIQYISENYTKKIYIDDLASEANMSRYHFCRFFKKYTGMTPVEYINVIRVNEASKLLASGNNSVTEIALLTGFENLSYFAKIFKQYKGISPSSLLKSYQINIS